MIRIAGNSHFSLSLYTLYLSGFFIHCLLENAREIGWSGRWHRGLERCGVMRRGCGELGLVLFPFQVCFLLPNYSMVLVRKQLRRRMVNCSSGEDQSPESVRRGQGDKPEAGTGQGDSGCC